jgi:hypothetical protein
LKNFLSLLVVSILVLSGSQAFGQQLSMGVAPHEVVKVTIDETGTAHVTHVVNSTGGNSNPIQVDLISGNMNNLNVTDTDGNSVGYLKNEGTPLSIIINPSQRDATLIKYDLVNVVTNTDGVWKWNYYEPQDTGFTAFHFPQGVDMIWANGRPVYLGDKGLGQNGNGFTLEYVINEPVNIQTVQSAGNNVAVGVRTVSVLGSYAFDQSQQAYSFNINKANVPVVVIMPQVLLSGPYAVTINGHPVLHQVFHNNATHAWIGFESANGGIVQITGAQGNQTGIPLGPSYTAPTGNAVIGEATPSSSDNTSIYLLIGGVIAAGIVGIIIVKKTRSKPATKS